MAFNLDFLKNKVWQVDGLTVTIGGLVLAAVIVWLVLRARK